MGAHTASHTRRMVYRRRDYFERGRFPIVVQRDVTHAARVPEHRHEFRELVIVTGGTCEHVCGPHRWPLRRGDVFVVLDGRLHGYERPSDLHITNVLFEPSRLGLPLRDISSLPGYHALFALEPAYRERHGYAGRLRLDSAGLDRALMLLELLEQELNRETPGFRFAATALFMQLVCHLARSYERASADDSGETVFRLAEALGHIERSYAEKLTVASVAAVAGLSRRHFQRLFLDAMGTSPIDYLIRLRVHKAAELLISEPGESITRIAFRTGFGDSNYFCRVFRSLTGLSPRAYRQRSGSGLAGANGR